MKRRTVLTLVGTLGAMVAGRLAMRLAGARSWPRGAEAGPFGILDGYKYANLTTFRESGEAVSTPVWFAAAGNRLYVGTDPESGKMKRIRNDPRVVLTPANPWGKPLGESVEGTAYPFEGDAPGSVWRALFGKYRLELGMAHLFGALPWYRPTLEIRPARPEL